MTKVKRIDITSSIRKLALTINLSLCEKLQSFYTSKLKSLGVVAKTFNYPFRFDTDSYVNRSFIKIKEIFIKHAVKLSPFLNFSEGDFINCSSSNGMTINLGDTGWVSEMPEWSPKKLANAKKHTGLNLREFRPEHITVDNVIQSGNYRIAWAHCSKKFGWAFRYANYLNYQFRKHDIPLSVAFETNCEHREGNNGKILKITGLFSFSGIVWVPVGDSSVERFGAIRKGAVDDSLFSDKGIWSETRLSEGPYAHGGSLFKNIYHPAKLFLHLDKIPTFINSLIRKLNYGPGAYIFRTVSDASSD